MLVPMVGYRAGTASVTEGFVVEVVGAMTEVGVVVAALVVASMVTPAVLSTPAVPVIVVRVPNGAAALVVLQGVRLHVSDVELITVPTDRTTVAVAVRCVVVWYSCAAAGNDATGGSDVRAVSLSPTG